MSGKNDLESPGYASRTQPQHTSEEIRKMRGPEAMRMSRADLLEADRLRTRERLLQVELSAGFNASYEEMAGNWELAELHRKYGNYMKLIRQNRPLPEKLKKGTE